MRADTNKQNTENMIPEALIGHTQAWKRCTDAVSHSGMPHAYLIVGPMHGGKAFFAQCFAQFLMDPAWDGRMQHVQRHYHDMTHVRPEEDAARATLTHISADATRAVARALATSALHGVRRVALIEDADRMTTTAQNALLKTLEELTEHHFIILTTAREGRVLPTIRSRCVRIALTSVSDDVVSEAACAWGISQQDHADVIRFAQGRLGLVHAYARSPDLLSAHRAWWSDAYKLFSITDAERIRIAENVASNAAHAQHVVAVWCAAWREVLRGGTVEEQRRAAQWIMRGHSTIAAIETTTRNTRLLIEDLVLRMRDDLHR